MFFFLVRIIRKMGFLQKFNFSINRHVNGKEVIIPVIAGHGDDNLAISELWMCSLIQKLLPLKVGSFIDIGVNIGQTLIKLRTVNATTDYIGFEPNPVCVYYTSQLIKANQYVNTRLIPVGLFNDNCVLRLSLFAEGGSDSAASLIDNFRPNDKVHQKIYVPVSKFESLKQMLQLETISIVKIDVEGAELEVLESLEDTIQSMRPFIFIEILPCYTKENANRLNRQLKIEQLLMRLRYKIFRVIKQDSHTVKALQPLNEIGVHDNMELCEYVMSPEETSSAVQGFF